MRNASKIKQTLKGYAEVFQYLYSSRTNHFLNARISTNTMIIILGLIGLLRNLLEVSIGGEWARAWFALTPDIFFTMFFYPIFICFFLTTLFHFFSNKFGQKVNLKSILSLMFFIQAIHLIIPFFDGLADLFNIPFRFYFGDFWYSILIFTPLAITPFILFFTMPTSFGINIAYIFSTFIILKLYVKHFKFSLLKTFSVLVIPFYVFYMSVYPVYYFFLNATMLGSNYMFGLFFLFLSIPSIIYVKTLLKE